MITKILENLDSAELSSEMKTLIEEAFSTAVEEKLDEEFEVRVAAKALELVDAKDIEYKKYLEENEATYLEEAQSFKNSLVDTIDAYIEQYVNEMVQDSLDDMRSDIENARAKAIVEAFDKLGLEVKSEQVDENIQTRELKVNELEKEINTLINENIELKNSIIDMKKETIINEASSNLTEIQKEKFMKLVEAFKDVKDMEDFTKKVKIITSSITESVVSEPVVSEPVIESAVETKSFKSRFL